jgi:hypothetical protein
MCRYQEMNAKIIKQQKVGRPKLDVNKNNVMSLCELRCTQEEIASVLGISQDTLIRNIHSWGFNSFAEFFRRYSARGNVSLRRAQYLSAMAGNVVMLKHLGVNWLKQKTKADEETDRIEEVTITVKFLDTK